MAFRYTLGGIIGGNSLTRRAASYGHTRLLSTGVHEEHIGNLPDIKPFEDIPGPKGIYQWPVLGTLLYLRPFTNIGPETVHHFFDQMFDKYGSIYKCRFGLPHVMVCDPKDIETVFRNEGKYPVRPSLRAGLTFSKRNSLKLDLSELSGEAWHAVRAPLNKRLSKVGSAHVYLPAQNTVTDEFVNILATQNMDSETLAELFFSYAAESIGVVCFNARLGFLVPAEMLKPEAAAFLKASKDVFTYLHKFETGGSIFHEWYRNRVYRGYEQATLTTRKATIKHIEQAKLDLESQKANGTFDPEKPNLLLSLISDKTVDPTDVIGIMQSLYNGGTDSTAKNLQVLFYNLATNPDKQENLREEVFSVVGKDQPVTVESLSKMNYLKATLKESFRRIYPTMSGTRRMLPTDVVLSGYKVPAGTVIGMHNPRTCRDNFSNPEKFIPERWLRSPEGHIAEEFPKVASLPFGHGPKNCIGRRFAEQELYLATVKVLQKLKIEVAEESVKTNFIYTIFIQPEKPIKFKFTKIQC